MSPAFADDSPTAPVPPAAAAPVWGPTGPGAFVTALCRDPQGRAVVATEGQGVWRYEPTSGQYAHFTAKDGLGSDDVYALAVDAKDRLWAGTLHGLSVYNGLTWKTYGVPEGLAGSRVFALAVCPKDGDVWIATEGGLTRYSLHHDTWRTYSRLDGLPSDALSCLAFDPQGNLYVGTQADGVAVTSRKSDYKTWRVTPGPARMPHVPDGRGLPSSLVNCLLVSSRDGSVYAGTDGGLARSRDGGAHWRFLRGADWTPLARAYRGGPPPEETWDAGDRLSESYVTALAEDGAGHLLVGHRRTGLDVFDERTGRSLPSDAASLRPGDYIEALLPWPGQTALMGFYGGGVATLADQAVSPAPHAAPPLAFGHLPPLPAPAAPPTLAQLNALLKTARAVPPDPAELSPHALALDDDWATEGDWLGRYGRYWAALFASSTPSDYLWGAGWEPVHYAVQAGPDRDKGDGLRYWVQWLYTQDPRVLELPSPYLDTRVKRSLTTWDVNRRESEVDDHGESYDEVKDGPGILLTVTVPPGLYTLSLYDVNYNGQAEFVAHRDYRLSLRPHRGTNLADIGDFAGSPEWAHGRVTDFWGGVWKRFLVRGPVSLTVQVDRNHGFNTMLAAAMLDLVDEMPPPYAGTPEGRLVWRNAQRDRLLARWRAAHAQGTCRLVPAPSAPQAADALLDTTRGMQFTNSAWWGVNGQCFYGPLLRWYRARADGSPKDRGLLSRLATCYYRMGLYPEWEECERKAGVMPARDVEKALHFDGTNGMGRGFEAITSHIAHPNTADGISQNKLASVGGPEGGGH